MLSDAITVGCNTVTRNTGSLLFRDILARLLQTILDLFKLLRGFVISEAVTYANNLVNHNRLVRATEGGPVRFARP